MEKRYQKNDGQAKETPVTKGTSRKTKVREATKAPRCTT